MSGPPPARVVDGEARNEETRELIYCHQCSKNFVALLDLRITGNHVILCCFCKHEHYRVVTNGRITDQRWHSQLDRVEVKRVWAAADPPIATTTAAMFIRERWLNRES